MRSLREKLTLITKSARDSITKSARDFLEAQKITLPKEIASARDNILTLKKERQNIKAELSRAAGLKESLIEEEAKYDKFMRDFPNEKEKNQADLEPYRQGAITGIKTWYEPAKVHSAWLETCEKKLDDLVQRADSEETQLPVQSVIDENKNARAAVDDAESARHSLHVAIACVNAQRFRLKYLMTTCQLSDGIKAFFYAQPRNIIEVNTIEKIFTLYLNALQNDQTTLDDYILQFGVAETYTPLITLFYYMHLLTVQILTMRKEYGKRAVEGTDTKPAVEAAGLMMSRLTQTLRSIEDQRKAILSEFTKSDAEFPDVVQQFNSLLNEPNVGLINLVLSEISGPTLENHLRVTEEYEQPTAELQGSHIAETDVVTMASKAKGAPLETSPPAFSSAETTVTTEDALTNELATQHSHSNSIDPLIPSANTLVGTEVSDTATRSQDSSCPLVTDSPEVRNITVIFYEHSQQYGYNRTIEFNDDMDQSLEKEIKDQEGMVRKHLHHQLGSGTALGDLNVSARLDGLHKVTLPTSRKAEREYKRNTYTDRDNHSSRGRISKIDTSALRLIREQNTVKGSHQQTYFTVRADLQISRIEDLEGLHNQTIAIFRRVKELMCDPVLQDWPDDIVPSISFTLKLGESFTYAPGELKRHFFDFLEQLAKNDEFSIHWKGLTGSCIKQHLRYSIVDSAGKSVFLFNPGGFHRFGATDEAVRTGFLSPGKSKEEVKRLCVLLRESPDSKDARPKDSFHDDWYRQTKELQYERLTESLRYMEDLAKREHTQNYKFDLTAGDIPAEFLSEAYMREKLCVEFVEFMEGVDFPLFKEIKIDRNSMVSQSVLLEFIEKLSSLENFRTTIVIKVPEFDSDFNDEFINGLVEKIREIGFCCDMKFEVYPLYQSQEKYRQACLKVASEIEKNRVKFRLEAAYNAWDQNKQYDAVEAVDESDQAVTNEIAISQKFEGKYYKINGASDNLTVGFNHALEQGQDRATDYAYNVTSHTSVGQGQSQSHQHENDLANFDPDELITRDNFRDKFRELLNHEAQHRYMDSKIWQSIILYVVKKYSIDDLNQIHKVRAHLQASFQQIGRWRRLRGLPIFPGDALEEFTVNDLDGIPQAIHNADHVIDEISRAFSISIFGHQLDRISAVSAEAFKELIATPNLMQADFNEFHLPAHFYIQQQVNDDKILSYNLDEPLNLVSVQAERNHFSPIIDMSLRHYYLLQDLIQKGENTRDFFKLALRSDLDLIGKVDDLTIEDYDDVLQDLNQNNQALLQTLYTTSPFELYQFLNMLKQLKEKNLKSYESFQENFLNRSANFADFTKTKILDQIFQTASLTDDELSWWNGLLLLHHTKYELSDFGQLWQGFSKFRSSLTEHGVRLNAYSPISSNDGLFILAANRDSGTTDMLTLMDRILLILSRVNHDDRQLQFNLITEANQNARLPLSYEYYTAVERHGYRFCTSEMRLDSNVVQDDYVPEKQALLQFIQAGQGARHTRHGGYESDYKQLFYRYVASQEKGLTLTQAQECLEQQLMPQINPIMAALMPDRTPLAARASVEDKALLANLVAFNPMLLQTTQTELSNTDILKMFSSDPIRFRAIFRRLGALQQMCNDMGCSLLELDANDLRPIFNDLCALPNAIQLIGAGDGSSYFDEILIMVQVALIIRRDVTTPLKFINQLLVNSATQIDPYHVKAIFYELMIEKLPNNSADYVQHLLNTESVPFLNGLLLKRCFQPDLKFNQYLKRLKSVLPAGDTSSNFIAGVIKIVSLLNIGSDKNLSQLKEVLVRLGSAYGSFQAGQLLDFYAYWCVEQSIVSADNSTEHLSSATLLNFMRFAENVLSKCKDRPALMDVFARDTQRVYQCLVSSEPSSSLLLSSLEESITSETLSETMLVYMRNVAISEDAYTQFPIDEALFPEEVIRTNIRFQADQYRLSADKSSEDTLSEFEEYVELLSQLNSHSFVDISVFLKPLSGFQVKKRILSFLESLQKVLSDKQGFKFNPVDLRLNDRIALLFSMAVEEAKYKISDSQDDHHLREITPELFRKILLLPPAMIADKNGNTLRWLVHSSIEAPSQTGRLIDCIETIFSRVSEVKLNHFVRQLSISSFRFSGDYYSGSTNPNFNHLIDLLMENGSDTDSFLDLLIYIQYTQQEKFLDSLIEKLSELQSVDERNALIKFLKSQLSLTNDYDIIKENTDVAKNLLKDVHSLLDAFNPDEEQADSSVVITARQSLFKMFSRFKHRRERVNLKYEFSEASMLPTLDNKRDSVLAFVQEALNVNTLRSHTQLAKKTPSYEELVAKLNEVRDLESGTHLPDNDKRRVKETLETFSEKLGEYANLSQTKLNQIANDGDGVARLAALVESFFRGRDFYLNSTQLLWLVCAANQEDNLVLQIATGQGKSTPTSMLLAAYKYFANPKSAIDVLSSNIELTQRELQENYPFFEALEIPVATVRENSPTGTRLSRGINFSSMDQMALYQLSALNRGETVDHDNSIVIADEIDYALFNDPTVYKLTEMEDINYWAWIYPELNAFVDQEISFIRGNTTAEVMKKFVDFLLAKSSISNEQKKQFFSKADDKMIYKWIHSALAAKELYHLEDKKFIQRQEMICERGVWKEYYVDRLIMENGEISDRAVWADGVQACLHSRRQVMTGETHYCTPEGKEIASINSRVFLSQYSQMIGLTATAGDAQQVAEMRELYEVTTWSQPSHHQSKRIDHPIMLARNEKAQWRELLAIINEKRHTTHEPVLIICDTVAESKRLYQFMQANKCQADLALPTDSNKHKVKIAKAGERDNVLITTDRDGRGRHIKISDCLRDNALGLCQISLSIANAQKTFQRRGRSGRQDNVGETYVVANREKEKLTKEQEALLSFSPESLFDDKWQQSEKLESVKNMLLSAREEISLNVYKDYCLLSSSNCFDGKGLSEVWNKFIEWLNENFIVSELINEDVFSDNQYNMLRVRVRELEKEAYEHWKAISNDFLNESELRNGKLAYSHSSRGFGARFVPKKFACEHLLRAVNLRVEASKEKPIVARQYNRSHKGKAVHYTSWFALIRAVLTGRRELFANTRAWLKNEGTLFANTKYSFRKKHEQSLLITSESKLLYNGSGSLSVHPINIPPSVLYKYRSVIKELGRDLLTHEDIETLSTEDINNPDYQAMFGYHTQYLGTGEDSVLGERTLVELARHQFIKAGVTSQACMDRATALLVDLVREGIVADYIETLTNMTWSKVNISFDKQTNMVLLSVNASFTDSMTGARKVVEVKFELEDSDQSEIKQINRASLQQTGIDVDHKATSIPSDSPLKVREENRLSEDALSSLDSDEERVTDTDVSSRLLMPSRVADDGSLRLFAPPKEKESYDLQPIEGASSITCITQS